MARPKGQPKLGGRQKGTPNKKTMEARELVERLGVDPLEILFHFCSRNWKALGYDSAYETKVLKDGGTLEVERITPDMRLNAAKEAARYVYPQSRAVELSSNNSEGVGFKIVLEDYTTEKK